MKLAIDKLKDELGFEEFLISNKFYKSQAHQDMYGTKQEAEDRISSYDIVIKSLVEYSELLERFEKLEQWAYNKASEEDLSFLNSVFKKDV